MTSRPTTDRFWISITVTLWMIAFLGLCARPLVQKTAALNKDKSSVYHDFSAAGANWLHGNPLYVRGGEHEFRYSPLVAALFVPLDLLPRRFGEFLWRSLNFITFIGGLYYCCTTGVPRTFSTRQFCAIFLLCLPLAIGSLNNAQSNPLVLGLMLIAVAAIVRQRWNLCAAAITFAVCFKLFPIALGMLLVLIFPWKIGWRMMVCLMIAAALPFAFQHAEYVTEQYKVWAHYLVTEDRQRGPMTDWYRDFRALWRVYVTPMRQQTYLILELTVAAMIAAMCALGHLRRMPIPLLLGFTLSLACCWMTVLGPATESATYILIAPAVAWGIVLSEINPKARLRRIGYALVFGLFLASQLALNVGPRGKFFRDHLQPLPLAGTLLLLIAMIDLLRHGRDAHATELNSISGR